MPDPETLVLTGGPHDGRLVDVKGEPGEYRIPIVPDIAGWRDEEPNPTTIDFRMGVYSPQTDEYGHVSRNDSGQLVYLWRGER